MQLRVTSTKVAMNDKQRLDWLEKMANKRGGILLHDGSERGRLGLGLRLDSTVVRTLRDAIDDCAKYDDKQKAAS